MNYQDILVYGSVIIGFLASVVESKKKERMDAKPFIIGVLVAVILGAVTSFM